MTYVYVPGESKGELPKYLSSLMRLPSSRTKSTHILPKLKARLILSVLKYLLHLPHILPNGWSLMTFRMNDGRRREKKEGKVLERTREYERVPCFSASLGRIR